MKQNAMERDAADCGQRRQARLASKRPSSGQSPNASPRRSRPQSGLHPARGKGGVPLTSRPQSSRPHTVGMGSKSARGEAEWPERMHPLMKEPEWRMRPQSSGMGTRVSAADWDYRPMGGLAPPTVFEGFAERRADREAQQAALRAQAERGHEMAPPEQPPVAGSRPSSGRH